MPGKKEKKFVDFSELPFNKVSSTQKITAKDVIIKGEKAKKTGKIRKISLEDEKEKPQVICHEKDGQIDIIEFICSCGNKTKVQVNYSD